MHTISRYQAPEGVLSRAYLIGCRLLQAVVVSVLHAIYVVFVWQERVRQRDQLQALDERSQRDIGLSRADIERETRKSFWQN